MAFQGYFIKFRKTNTEFQAGKYIQTYKVTPNQRSDLDDYTDANGLLHINVLSHTSTKIELNTKPMWTSDWEEMMALFKANYSNELERRIELEYYDQESGEYKVGDFYVPDFTPEILLVKRENNKYLVNACRFAFIEF